MPFLPDPRGRFPVGATTFVTRVKAPRSIGNITLRDSHQPALLLEEVVFTAYYPADTSRATKKGLDWIVRPLKESSRGFAKFSSLPSWLIAPIVYLFGALIRIPVYPDAPLARPRENIPGTKNAKQWPLVIFSHGLGGSRTAYSQLCSRLAASGKVVLAMEHHDGTGCTCITRTRQPDGTLQSKSILYYKDEDIIFSQGGSHVQQASYPLRTNQLELRCEEIHTAYHTFSDFVRNDGYFALETIDNSQIDCSSWREMNSKSGDSPICFDADVTLAGHSFGGCTVFSIISSDPPSGYLRIPVSHALVLDPWLEPLPLPGPVPLSQVAVTAEMEPAIASSSSHSLTVAGDSNAPEQNTALQVLVINSERFTLWKNHYSRLKDVIKGWEPHRKRLLTLVGSTHEAFSDFPSLPLIRRAKAKLFMDTIAKLSISFLDNGLDQTLDSVSTTKMEIGIVGKKKDGQPRRKLVGKIGDVIIQ